MHEVTRLLNAIEHGGRSDARKRVQVNVLRTGRALIVQKTLGRGTAALLHMNQPTGFDCPGCAWTEPKHGEPVQFWVEVLDGGQSRDRVPREGAIHLVRAGPDFEQRADVGEELGLHAQIAVGAASRAGRNPGSHFFLNQEYAAFEQ